MNTFTYHSPSDSGEKKSDSLGVGTPQTNRPVLYKSDNVGMSRSNEGRQKHRSPLHTLLDEQLQYDHVAHNSSHSKEGSRFTWGGGGAGVHAALKENTNTGNASSSSGSTSINGSSGSVTAGMAKRTSSSRDVSSSTGSSKKSRSSDDNNHKSKRRVSRQSLSRRQAVSECRVLKEAITSFEASFKDNYGRAPKSADRGEMQQVGITLPLFLTVSSYFKYCDEDDATHSRISLYLNHLLHTKHYFFPFLYFYPLTFILYFPTRTLPTPHSHLQ